MSSIAHEPTDGPDEVDVLNDSNFTSASSSKRGREIDEIEGAFKRSVTGALNLQRPLFVLDKHVITPEDAQRFQAQANRWCNNFTVNEVVVEPASDLIETCLHTDTDLTVIERELIPLWMEHLTVPQVAELVTKYFGTQPNTSRTLAENFGKVDFKFCYNDASHERETSLEYISLIRAHEVTSTITPEQHAQLIVILEKRLPPDSQIRTDYFTSRGPKPLVETWKQAFSRFLRCVGSVRTSMLKNQQYGDANTVYRYNRGKSPPHHQFESKPRLLEHHAPSQAESKSMPPAPLLPRTCNSCGIEDHDRPACPYLNRGDSNRDESKDWRNSSMGQLWLSYGFSCYQPKLALPGHSNVVIPPPADSDPRTVRFKAESTGSRDQPPRDEHRHRSGQNRRSKNNDPIIMLASSHSSLHSHLEYLPITIFLNPQRHKARTSHNTNAQIIPSRTVDASALLDTGSLAADFVSQAVVDRLVGNKLSYTSPHPMTVCSGLDSTCYQSAQVIDIGISFFTSAKIKKTIFLTARINAATTVDLIIGRESLYRHNFFALTPDHLGMPKTVPVQAVFAPKLGDACAWSPVAPPQTTLPSEAVPEAHVGRSGCTPNFCSRNHALGAHQTACHVCEILRSPPCVTASRATSDCDPHRFGIDPHRTISPTASREVGALLDAAAEVPSGIVLSVDEIDNDKTDTFGPFRSAKPPEEATTSSHAFLLQITFEGSEDLQRRCKLLCIEFADIFSDTLNPLPADFKPFEIDIDLAQWETPQNRGPVRPQSVKKELVLDATLKELLLSGVIERSDAAYYSHPCIVTRTENSYRVCIDFRLLNACLRRAGFPLPLATAICDRIGFYFPDTYGIVDLTSGYHQAPLAQAARIFTAFICFAGVFQFTRLPFGLKHAPSYFQEQMATTVLYGLLYVICEIYLDDCIIYARGDDEFLERLELVFRRFRLKRLLIKAKKCKFGLKRIEYIGRVLSSEGVSMSKDKIESVLNFPRPKDMTSLRALLGLANYFRMFVPEHSTIVAPLHRLIDHSAKKRCPIVWTDDSLTAFRDIRIAISRCPLLHFIDDVSPIRLYTDASAYGIGGALFQIVNDVWKPIAFISKSLTAVQLKWSTIQTEAYAIFYCCSKLDHLLRDRQFTIHTDHQNLTYMTKNSSSMVSRWYIALQELDFTIEFVKGSQNTIADAFSRLCPNLTEIALPVPNPEIPGDGAVVAALRAVPAANDEQLEALEMCHNSMVGHGGTDRTMAKLHSLDYGWLYMRQHVKLFIRECACCQKMSFIKVPIHVHHYVTSTYTPFEVLNIDYVGPYPDEGYVLVIICAFTRWTELYWCRDATAAWASDCLLQHFGRFGAPSMIRSDRGSHFANELIKEFLDRTGTPHNLTLAYSKQENALVERVNREVNRHLRAFIFDSTDLASYRAHLPFVQRIINASVHASTGASPASLLFGNTVLLDKGILMPTPEVPTTLTSASKKVADMIRAQDILITKAATRLRAADDAHLTTGSVQLTTFPVDSYVLAQYATTPPTRLHTKWEGPFRVLSSSQSEYTLLNLITKKHRTVHASKLKTFVFDPATQDPADTARRDYMEFFVESILAHRGDRKKVSSLSFLVKWLNYDSSMNTWEPWGNLRLCEPLHTYLRAHSMSSLIPRSIRDASFE